MTTLMRTILNVNIAPVIFPLDVTYQQVFQEIKLYFLKIIGSWAGFDIDQLVMIMYNNQNC